MGGFGDEALRLRERGVELISCPTCGRCKIDLFSLAEQAEYLAAASDNLRKLEAALARGDRVELRGFGAFSVRQRDSRKGRNPRTGEPVEVPAKSVPFFKAGKELRARVNGGEDPEAR